MNTKESGTVRRNAFAMAVIVLAVHAGTVAVAQSAQTQVRARGMIVDTVLKADSVRVATKMTLPKLLERVDSLVRRQNEMTIGSPEYIRIENELLAMIGLYLPKPGDAQGNFTVRLIPGSLDSARRILFDVQRPDDGARRGWIGIRADGVSTPVWSDRDGEHIQYFVYPTVVSVDANSPAAKGGILFGDSLLAYNGLDLRRNVINLTRMLEPGRALRVSLRRDGENKDVTIIPERIPASIEHERQVTRMLVPSRAPTPMSDSMERRLVESRARSGGARGRGVPGVEFPRTPVAVATRAPDAIFGARMTDLDSAAVRALTRKKQSHGVLVAGRVVGSPAERMGLEPGDIIVAVDAVEVVSINQLRRELALRGQNTTKLTVVRDGKTKKLTYEPR